MQDLVYVRLRAELWDTCGVGSESRESSVVLPFAVRPCQVIVGLEDFQILSAIRRAVSVAKGMVVRPKRIVCDLQIKLRNLLNVIHRVVVRGFILKWHAI